MYFLFHLEEKVINIYLRINKSYTICTSNHMLASGIWDKLPKCIFENFEIAWVKRRQF